MEDDIEHDIEDDFDDTVLRGLQRYVRLVSQAMGLRGECSYFPAGEIASAYIALDGRFSRCPDRDVALLWDENQGWSAAIETHSEEDLLVVAHLGQDLLPLPKAVAAWAAGLFDPHHETDHIGHVGERPGRADADEIRHRLAAYARPVYATTPPEGA